VSIEAIIAAETNKKLECEVNSRIKNIFGVKVTVNGFGASDCKNNCGSHLLHFPGLEDADSIIKILSRYLTSLANINSVHIIR
jgi:Uri superfamily endonuclease